MNKLLVLSLFALLGATQATHFRYYTARWVTEGLKVDLTILAAFRATFFCNPCSPSCIGTTSGTGGHTWGDGTSFSQDLKWTAQCCAEDWMEGVQMISHTYSSPGTYTLDYDNCCRIGSLQNSAHHWWRMSTTITVNTDPAQCVGGSIGLLPIEPVNKNQPYTRDLKSVSAIPSGATNLQYSQGTDCGALVQISNLNVDPSGILTWDPSVLPAGLYTACVYVDYTFMGADFRLIVDWIFESNVNNAGNDPPVWDDPPSEQDGTIIPATAGTPVSFDMQASDPNSGDVVMITCTGIPIGAVVTINDGNPATWNFNWTPTPADVGFPIINCVASDGNGGFTETRAITLEVDATSGGGDCEDSEAIAVGSTAGNAHSDGSCIELCFEEPA